jgi:hypothetical protein
LDKKKKNRISVPLKRRFMKNFCIIWKKDIQRKVAQKGIKMNPWKHKHTLISPRIYIFLFKYCSVL